MATPAEVMLLFRNLSVGGTETAGPENAAPENAGPNVFSCAALCIPPFGLVFSVDPSLSQSEKNKKSRYHFQGYLRCRAGAQWRTVSTNRYDLFQTTVHHSLLKTKHLADTVSCGCYGDAGQRVSKREKHVHTTFGQIILIVCDTT